MYSVLISSTPDHGGNGDGARLHGRIQARRAGGAGMEKSLFLLPFGWMAVCPALLCMEAAPTIRSVKQVTWRPGASGG